MTESFVENYYHLRRLLMSFIALLNKVKQSKLNVGQIYPIFGQRLHDLHWGNTIYKEQLRGNPY